MASELVKQLVKDIEIAKYVKTKVWELRSYGLSDATYNEVLQKSDKKIAAITEILNELDV